MRFLLVAIALGCSSANGSRDTETSPDTKTATDSSVEDGTDSAIDTAVEDTTPGGRDAIFPIEDTNIGDVSSCDCIDVKVNVADCGSVMCPAEYPYPVGCSITMGGTDSRGCVVHAAGSSKVTFKVGTSCGSSTPIVTGIVRCGKTMGAMLDATNCPITKPMKRYVATLSACP